MTETCHVVETSAHLGDNRQRSETLSDGWPGLAPIRSPGWQAASAQTIIIPHGIEPTVIEGAVQRGRS